MTLGSCASTRRLLLALSLALAVGAIVAGSAAAATTEHIYARGKTFTIDTSQTIFLNADQSVLGAAAPFYIIGFPVKPGTMGPIKLPSGYRPQNNGQPAPVPYHDHITGTLGNPLRHVIELRYSHAYAYSPKFVPLTSVGQLGPAEKTGKLDVVDPAAPDPYRHSTSTVLVRPLVCPHR